MSDQFEVPEPITCSPYHEPGPFAGRDPGSKHGTWRYEMARKVSAVRDILDP
ncbi:MAG TPA: hypothetical protein PLH72_01060 [Vicinamibacterales bacterium]|nr:hypothetical protein [Vicinamibacterales bacterium]